MADYKRGVVYYDAFNIYGTFRNKKHQTRMDVVDNNLSNVNTVGFKSGRATFADMLSQTIKGATAANGTVGGTNPKQIGLGVGLGSVDTIFTNGAPITTDKNTDLCLSGDGLFVVKKNNETFYTRNGAFSFDAEGNYVMPGSGHIVQGWMASDGVINPTGAVGDIKVTKGQPLVDATNLVTCFDNLDAGVPTITGIRVPKDDLKVGFAIDREVGIRGIPDNGKTWRFKNDVPLGATSAIIEDDDGNTATVTLSPAAGMEIPKGTDVDFETLHVLTKGSVTTNYPIVIIFAGKQYTAIAMDSDMDLTKKWSLKQGEVSAGSNTITVTDGTNEIILTLNSPLTDNLDEDKVATAIASEAKPATITFSDGTTVVRTDGVYNVGTSLPVSITTIVYDSSGTAYTLPLYFIRKEGANSDNKWLVSLSPDTSVTKGQNITTGVTDAQGNNVPASFAVTEIQFDDAGNLISDNTSILTIGTQNITVDFSKVTQLPSETTVNATSNGGVGATLTDVQIDSSGIVTGIYSNGVRRQEAQVAIAHFNNPAGLFKTGTSLYKESANSGDPLLIKAGEFDVSIMTGALEMSNVNIANEFSDMIITQRGFQSNSKLITVGDEMLETAINMKR
ncbi:flagellar hook-basal body complex protein [Anaerovibrio sp.]|uniref:flagellar hook protein FlgE n=1 Tax=Anaerovibrio sp. TaxID=1872532 RepID=UPI0025C40CB8|nr:flagellar hook-basal body complex protein [Anaerovibrio sp.]MBR2143598.1 flagellar hook-basal body complex protein [Anaerovibrio sp.]